MAKIQLKRSNRNKDLKKGVDHIGVTCVFFCHDGKGNLLMQKRSQECRDERRRWDCGSGSMEFGETFEETVKREIKEEYCVEAKNLKFCGVRNVLRKNGKINTHWVALIFAAKVNPKKAKIGEKRKIEEIGLFPAKKLPKPQHSMLKKHLATVRRTGVKI
ncbi:MAG: NUDIX domain-containing protein [Minisyncoccia bacterium]